MTLKKLVNEIMREQNYSQRHAYRLAHEILDECERPLPKDNEEAILELVGKKVRLK